MRKVYIALDVHKSSISIALALRGVAVLRDIFDVVLGTVRGIVLLLHSYQPLQGDVCIENVAVEAEAPPGAPIASNRWFK